VWSQPGWAIGRAAAIAVLLPAAFAFSVAFPSLASAELGHCELLAGGQPGQQENETALDIHNPLVGDGTITEWGFVGTLGGNGTVYLDIFKPGFETHPELAGQIAYTTTEGFQDESVYIPAKIPVSAGEGFGVTVSAGADVEKQTPNVAQVICTSGAEGSSDSFLDIWEAPFHTGLVPNKEGPGEVQILGRRFEYDQPVITSVEPESGPAAGGTEVTIHGEHLAYGQAGFPENGTKVAGQSPALHEDTELKVITPEAVTGAASELSVRTYAGTAKHKFTYTGTPRSRTPQLVLDPVTNVTESSAEVHATVNVEGLIANYEDEPGTYCYFGYGVVEVEEETDECDPLPEAFSETPEAVSARLEGLAPGTTYHYLLEVASKYSLRSGHAETDDTASFTTLGTGGGGSGGEEAEKPAKKSEEPTKELSGTAPAPTSPLPIGTTPLTPTPFPITPPPHALAIPAAGLVGGGSATATPAGIVPVKVSCPAGETSCIGSITLTAIGPAGSASAGREAKAKKKSALTLATGAFTVAGGKTATVQLHLSSKAKALLEHSHSLRAQVTIVAHDAAGATHTTQSKITIRAPKSPRH
jgi:IPT/TIG domain